MITKYYFKCILTHTDENSKLIPRMFVIDTLGNFSIPNLKPDDLNNPNTSEMIRNLLKHELELSSDFKCDIDIRGSIKYNISLHDYAKLKNNKTGLYEYKISEDSYNPDHNICIILNDEILNITGYSIPNNFERHYDQYVSNIKEKKINIFLFDKKNQSKMESHLIKLENCRTRFDNIVFIDYDEEFGIEKALQKFEQADESKQTLLIFGFDTLIHDYTKRLSIADPFIDEYRAKQIFCDKLRSKIGKITVIIADPIISPIHVNNYRPHFLPPNKKLQHSLTLLDNSSFISRLDMIDGNIVETIIKNI